MLLLISPAKTMKEERIHIPQQVPVFLEKSNQILQELQNFQEQDIKKLMKVSDTIAQQALFRFHNMHFDMQGVCALDAYDGVQFKSMQLSNMNTKERDYLNTHLRILSGFYGLVHPDDSIYPYRLEMQTPLAIQGSRNLYDFWKDEIAKVVIKESNMHAHPYIINLSSKEYERVIRPYIPAELWVDMKFYTIEKGNLTARSMQVKKARGMMVRYLALHDVKELEEVKGFDLDGYHYHEEYSSKQELVFVKGGEGS